MFYANNPYLLWLGICSGDLGHWILSPKRRAQARRFPTCELGDPADSHYQVACLPCLSPKSVYSTHKWMHIHNSNEFLMGISQWASVLLKNRDLGWGEKGKGRYPHQSKFSSHVPAALFHHKERTALFPSIMSFLWCQQMMRQNPSTQSSLWKTNNMKLKMKKKVLHFLSPGGKNDDAQDKLPSPFSSSSSFKIYSTQTEQEDFCYA